MFVEEMSHAGGRTTGAASEAHALMLLRRARQQSSAIEATSKGGARITWTRPSGAGAVAVRSIVLTPTADPTPFDETVLPYLAIAATGDAWIEPSRNGQVICTFLNVVSPGATARLLARGLVAEYGAQRRVRLTLAGGLGLIAAAHQPITDGADLRCTCGHVGRHDGDQPARIHARGHLRRVTAQFVDRLGPAFTTAVQAAS